MCACVDKGQRSDVVRAKDRRGLCVGKGQKRAVVGKRQRRALCGQGTEEGTTIQLCNKGKTVRSPLTGAC